MGQRAKAHHPQKKGVIMHFTLSEVKPLLWLNVHRLGRHLTVPTGHADKITLA